MGHRSDAWFVTTHWSVVLSARDKSSPGSAEALEALCRAYWSPLYAFVRRQGHDPHEAEDLTQEFFARLLQKDYLHSVAREKGRFRTFLLVSIKRFLANEWDRARALKRGGGKTVLDLDTTAAEAHYQVESKASLSPDALFERRWALSLLEQTMTRLRQDYADAGKLGEFEILKGFLTAEKGEAPYAEASVKTGLSEGAVRVAVHRLRRRYREVFRQQIAHTVDRPEEIEAEVRHLLEVLSQ